MSTKELGMQNRLVDITEVVAGYLSGLCDKYAVDMLLRLIRADFGTTLTVEEVVALPYDRDFSAAVAALIMQRMVQLEPVVFLGAEGVA